MRTRLLLALTIVAIFCFSCEKDEFETVNNEVYQIDTVIKKGCFLYDFNDTMSIMPVPTYIIKAEKIDDKLIVMTTEDFYCSAKDSIILKGNVLSIYLKAVDIAEQCDCSYGWELHLDINDYKGLKLLMYEYENNRYGLTFEAYWL